MTTYQSQRVAAIIQHSTAQMSETAATSAGSYISRFNSGGKVFEDNGGMPMLPDQQQVQCVFKMLLPASAGMSDLTSQNSLLHRTSWSTRQIMGMA